MPFTDYLARLLAFALTLAFFSPAHAERLALVIGNDAYLHLPPLEKAVNDARQMTAALTRLGFKVETAYNVTYATFITKLSRFRDSVGPGDEVVVFFAGHGVAIGERNYLLPIDLNRPEPGPGEEDLIKGFSRDAADLVESIHAKKPRFVFAVFDACRNNPFAAPGRRAIGDTRGLRRMEAQSDALLFFSAGPGQEALDRLPGDRPEETSVFTRVLLQHLEKPGLTLLDIVIATKREVKRLALERRNHQQFPDYSDRTEEDIVLKPAPQGGNADAAYGRAIAAGGDEALQRFAAAFPADPRAARIKEEFARRADEEAFVEAVAAGTKEALEAYVAQPNARRKAQAEAMLARWRPPSPPPCDGEVILVGTKPADESRCIRPGSGRSFRDCADCPEMVVLPAGTFTMGSPANEPERNFMKQYIQNYDEGPRHDVRIPQAFSVGKFEVTFAEWDACAAAGGCERYRPADQGWGRGRFPVINVSWDDAKKYVAWLSQKTGKQYRLLSESEWEYVARAGTQAPFWWGSSINPAQANYNGTVAYNGGAVGEYRGRTVEVDAFAPNAWGLHQVHGNVWEWVEDCWSDNYTSKISKLNQSSIAFTTQSCSSRVLRGGSWNGGPWILRSASRSRSSPDLRVDRGGFRVARTLLPL